MTETELNAVRDLQVMIREKEQRLRLLEESLTNPVPIRDGLPRGKNLSRLMEQLGTETLELERLRERLNEAKANLTLTICAANLDARETAIIHRRYVRCMRFRDIGFELAWSDATVFSLHRKAVRKILGGK